jgi:hypothetical protein
LDGTRPPDDNALAPYTNAYAIIRRRGGETSRSSAAITRRVTGITTYRKNGGTLEVTAATADHASTRQSQLYDRCTEETSLHYLEVVID